MFARNWIFYLSGAFLLLGLLYAFRSLIEDFTIPDPARVAIGIVFSFTLFLAAFTRFRNNRLLSEILAGTGTFVLFLVFIYASFASSLQWSTITLMLCLIPVSLLLVFLAQTFSLRVFTSISVLGGYLTVMVVQAGEQHLLLLFLYLTILNLLVIYLSAQREWMELPFLSFLSIFIIYLSYYLRFSPAKWLEPFLYITAFFLTFLLGMVYRVRRNPKEFAAAEIYLNFVNAVHYIFWSVLLFGTVAMPIALPLIITGATFLLIAFWLYHIFSEQQLPASAYFFGGLLLIAFSAESLGQPFQETGHHYAIQTTIWLVIIAVLYLASLHLKNTYLHVTAVVLFLINLLYWFGHAWDVQWIPIWGIPFIPFINAGALVWIAFAIAAFAASLRTPSFIEQNPEPLIDIPPVFYQKFLGLIGHLVTGGLLTIQISNLWEAYAIALLPPGIVISAAWSLYALSLFSWGAYVKDVLYKYFGSGVLLLTAAKVLLYDIEGQSNLFKTATFIGMGVIMLAIALLNRRWETK